MRVGLQYVGQSAPLKGVLLRICIFFFHSTGLTARCCRCWRGASRAATPAPSRCCWPQWAPARSPSPACCPRCASATAATAWCCAARCCRPQQWRRWPGPSNLDRAAGDAAGRRGLDHDRQHAERVDPAAAARLGARARGMSLYQMAIMGAKRRRRGALGPGRRADQPVGQRRTRRSDRRAGDVAGQPPDARPRPARGSDAQAHLPGARAPRAAPQGQVLVTVEYRIAPEQAAEFRQLMLGESRAARLRQGALSWGAAARPEPARALHRGHRRPVLDRPPAPLRARHRGRRRTARAQARLPPRTRAAEGEPAPDGVDRQAGLICPQTAKRHQPDRET